SLRTTRPSHRGTRSSLNSRRRNRTSSGSKRSVLRRKRESIRLAERSGTRLRPACTKGLCVVLTALIVRPVAFPSAAPQEAPLLVRARGRSFQLAAIQVFRDCFAPTEWHSPYRFRHRPE